MINQSDEPVKMYYPASSAYQVSNGVGYAPTCANVFLDQRSARRDPIEALGDSILGRHIGSLSWLFAGLYIVVWSRNEMF
jgi:hypothetical protein